MFQATKHVIDDVLAELDNPYGAEGESGISGPQLVIVTPDISRTRSPTGFRYYVTKIDDERAEISLTLKMLDHIGVGVGDYVAVRYCPADEWFALMRGDKATGFKVFGRQGATPRAKFYIPLGEQLPNPRCDDVPSYAGSVTKESSDLYNYLILQLESMDGPNT